jgi:translation initiation factor IF-3
VNDAITSLQVRVIDQNGEQLGVISTDEAMNKAFDASLDLVEVSPNAEPPVCKIIDYGKYKFQMQKKAAEMRKNQVKTTLKEVTIRPQTEEHDYQIKLKNIVKFIGKGDKVKVSLRFRGREITHKDLGYDMLKRIQDDTKDIAKVDQAPKMEGRFMLLMLSPLASRK